MMKFADFFLTEDPDNARLHIDGSDIELEWEDDNAYTFGFINTDVDDNGVSLFDGIDKKYNNQFIINQGGTHFDIVEDFLKSIGSGIIKTRDEDDSSRIIEFDLSKPIDRKKFNSGGYSNYIAATNSRKILNPCGRLWVNEKVENSDMVIDVISLWSYRDTSYSSNNMKQVTKSHMKRIFEEAKKINPKIKEDMTLVEFLGDKNTGITQTYKEYMSGEQPYTSDLDSDQIERIEKKRLGAHGNPINSDFGAAAQANRARNRGYATIAAMNASKEGD